MEEDKMVTDGIVTDATVSDGTAESVATETAPVEDAPASASAAVSAEDEDISTRLRRAGDRIDRVGSEAEMIRRRREKESAMAERDGERMRESEKRKIEDDEKRREAAEEERRAAMEYAESYRARLRAEKENNAAMRKKAEAKERARAEERSAREREIAEGIERERKEARERGARAESLLARVDGSVSSLAAAPTVLEEIKKSDTTDPVSSISPEVEPSAGADTPTAPTASAADTVTATSDEGKASAAAVVPDSVSPSADEGVGASADASEASTASAPTDDYVITIEDDAPRKDILYIDGTTACEIAIGGTAAGVAATAASKAAATTGAATAASKAVATTGAATATLATVDAVEPPSSAKAKDISAPEVDAAIAPAPSTALDGYTEVVRDSGCTAATRSLDEYSSMVSAVKRSDIPGTPVSFDEGTPIGDYEANHELLHHADGVSRKQYTVTKRGDEFDISPRYPDPVGEPLTPKEAKRREKEALAEERRALLEFEQMSKRRRIKKGQRSAEERALEEYESAEEARLAAGESEKIPAVPESSSEMTAPVSNIDSAYPDPKPASPTAASGVDTTARATPVFDKKALEKNRKRQVKNDLLLIEHRIYDEIRRLEMDTRTGEISFTAKIEEGKDRRERSRKRVELSDTRRRLKLARKYESEDNSRYYQLVMLDVERARLPRRTDRNELRELRERLMSLLKSRDEMNLKLIELYSISEGGKSGRAQGRFNAELEGKRRAFKRQLPIYRKYERARIALSDKEILYPLMDERTELCGELSKINYMLKKEKAKGLSRRELLKDRRRVERKLDENRRAIIHNEKKAMRRAERRAEGNRAAIFGWTVLGIIAVAALLAVIFWKDIQPWITNTAFPWIGEKFGQLFEWVTSLMNGGENSPTTPAE